MTIQTTHTITLAFSIDHKGHPMATIYEKTDPEWNAREDFIEWLSKYGANKGSGAGAILDATNNTTPSHIADFYPREQA